MVFLCIDNYPSHKEAIYCQYFQQFQYTLSDFQKYAIEAVVEGHHSLICVPTGSGKTLPAIFTILHLHFLKKKVIYTGPIKSLLNQKYYEFTTNYPHIQFGLMTGDIKINPDADVILMTAEILANALFHKKEENVQTQLQFNIDIETQLGAVIMDEVHYINDAERGAVWEKTILMLPHHVQMVMLSATLDNPMQFAQWIESTRVVDTRVEMPTHKHVYLSYNSIRHVPLTHYGFVACPSSSLKLIKDKELQKEMQENTGKLILLQNEKNVYNENGYKTIKKTLELIEDRNINIRRKFVLNNLCEYMRTNELLPAICFVFSRKNVESCAGEITANLLEDDSKIPYTMARECEQIIRAKLPNWREYADLPEYQKMVKLLEKGIGIHHSGMIPILREIVELMISRGCVKLLFATESFAIGLDCPIRTAVFTGLMKYDGILFRELYAHEYSQASGRAGRRGRDLVGYVIHCYLNGLDGLPPSANYQKILCGKPQVLESKYEINYSTILDLMKKGQTCDFHLFSEKSMLRGQLMAQIKGTNDEIEKINSTIEEKEKSVKYLRTPNDICVKYLSLEKIRKTAINKKKKECEKEITNLKNNWKTLVDDSTRICELETLKDEYNALCNRKQYLEIYIKTKSLNICYILQHYAFIEPLDATPSSSPSSPSSPFFVLTPKGRLASNISEIHPLVLCSIIFNGKMDKLSVIEVIGVLSCFVDVKIPEQLQKPYIDTKNENVKSVVEIMYEYYDKYRNMEYDVLETYLTKSDELHTGIIDPMMYWAEFCNNEEECKEFMAMYANGIIVDDLMEEKEYAGLFSVGDFAKACIKISGIAKELGAVCEELGYIEFAHKLAKIDACILKYIATTQSLYI